jgi:hypothetical protein
MHSCFMTASALCWQKCDFISNQNLDYLESNCEGTQLLIRDNLYSKHFRSAGFLFYSGREFDPEQ